MRDGRVLIVEPLLGLSNRLHALLSAQRLAVQSGRRLHVIWANNYPTQPAHSDCRLDELFETDLPQLDSFERMQPPIPVVRFVSQPRFVAWERIAIPRAIELGFSAPAVDVDAYRDAPAIGITAFHLVGLPGETREQLLRGAAEEFVRLRPVGQVEQVVAEFRARHFTAPILGIHVRRGDYGPVLSRLGVAAPEESDFAAYVEACRARLPTLRVFVASDDESVKHRLLERFGAFACAYRSAALDRTTGGMRCALIELLLLNHTGFVCGTPTSTFSVTGALRNLAARGATAACVAALPAGIGQVAARLAALVAQTVAALRNR